ncbi:hypothetical protein ABZ260_00030 [Streptosporangium sp. NPDC006013]|uniref:hypothetical protein n=1 Tax=Streptosporangium sp. NPDC006013 TaxID=3155596 RepID=UPI0033AEF8C6
MPLGTDGEKDDEKDGENLQDWKTGVGEMVADLFSYWMFGPGAYTAGESDRQYGPVKLVIWTVFAIGIAAAVSALRIALFGEPRAGWGIALVPLILPMVGALAYRPRHYIPGLVLGVIAGLLTTVGLGLDLGSTTSSFWGGLAVVSAGFLVCSVVFAAVTWPRR